MIETLMDEYRVCAQSLESVDYADEDSVLRFNNSSDRMRAIVGEIVTHGAPAIASFVSVLDDIGPAHVWAAHHLVEMSNLDLETLAKCFQIVEQAQRRAEALGAFATAMGESMWLREWKSKRSMT